MIKRTLTTGAVAVAVLLIGGCDTSPPAANVPPVEGASVAATAVAPAPSGPKPNLGLPPTSTGTPLIIRKRFMGESVDPLLRKLAFTEYHGGPDACSPADGCQEYRFDNSDGRDWFEQHTAQAVNGKVAFYDYRMKSRHGLNRDLVPTVGELVGASSDPPTYVANRTPSSTKVGYGGNGVLQSGIWVYDDVMLIVLAESTRDPRYGAKLPYFEDYLVHSYTMVRCDVVHKSMRAWCNLEEQAKKQDNELRPPKN